MNKELETLLVRGVPSVMFAALAVPITRRLIRGAIPADPAEGVPRPLNRTDSPRAYWLMMTAHLLILALVGMAVVGAWFFFP